MIEMILYISVAAIITYMILIVVALLFQKKDIKRRKNKKNTTKRKAVLYVAFGDFLAILVLIAIGLAITAVFYACGWFDVGDSKEELMYWQYKEVFDNK